MVVGCPHQVPAVGRERTPHGVQNLVLRSRSQVNLVESTSVLPKVVFIEPDDREVLGYEVRGRFVDILVLVLVLYFCDNSLTQLGVALVGLKNDVAEPTVLLGLGAESVLSISQRLTFPSKAWRRQSTASDFHFSGFLTLRPTRRCSYCLRLRSHLLLRRV
jgi:hypothetical protein